MYPGDIFQVKFQVYISLRNWSHSSRHWKMVLPRMDSPDLSTTISLTVSTVVLLTAWSLCLSVVHCSFVRVSSHCKPLLYVTFCYRDCFFCFSPWLYPTVFFCFIAAHCCWYCINAAMSQRLLLVNQINNHYWQSKTTKELTPHLFFPTLPDTS